MSNLKIYDLLPANLRNVFNEGFTQVLDSHLSDRNTERVVGYVGDKNTTDPYIQQRTVDNEVNALTPFISTTVNGESVVYSINDVYSHLEMSGADLSDIGRILSDTSFRFSVPVDYDRLVNYHKYYWYGHLLERTTDGYDLTRSVGFDATTGMFNQTAMSTTWTVTHNYGHTPEFALFAVNQFGNLHAVQPTDDRIVSITNSSSALTVVFSEPLRGSIAIKTLHDLNRLPIQAPSYNPDMQPEYVGISRHGLPTNRDSRSEFDRGDYWIHEQDIVASGLSAPDLIRATYPIITFDHDVELSNAYTQSGSPAPADVTVPGRVPYTQSKWQLNQAPLFNLYHHTGEFAGLVSPILSFERDQADVVDAELQFRADVDKYGDYMLVNGFVDRITGEIYAIRKAGALMSCWVKGSDVETQQYYSRDSDGNTEVVNPDDDLLKIGAWESPTALYHNAKHETRRNVPYADLYRHFADMMEHTDGFEGSPYASNNYRNIRHGVLSRNGGNIRDYTQNIANVCGIGIHENVTIPTIIEYAKREYDIALNFVHEFVIRDFADRIAEFVGVPTMQYGTTTHVETREYAELKSRFASRNSATVFADSTAPHQLPATLPILGFIPAVEPAVVLMRETGQYVVRHHDGHHTPLSATDIGMLVKITNAQVLRSDGVEIGGIVGEIPPTVPYRNQLWLKPMDGKMYAFAVDCDRREDIPAFADRITGATKFYDRAAQVLYVWSDIDWVAVDQSTAWVEVNPFVLIDNLTLMLENDLHAKSVRTRQYSSVFGGFVADDMAVINRSLESSYYRYLIKSEQSPRDTDFDPSNAFSWNYRDAVIPQLDGQIKCRWYDIYAAIYGTSRPDLEPWAVLGYPAEPQWMAAYADPVTRKYTAELYDMVATGVGLPETPPRAFVGAVPVSRDSRELIPPYVSIHSPDAANALLTEIPRNIARHYEYGDNGSLEFSWRHGVDYAYDFLTALYAAKPLQFMTGLFDVPVISGIDGYPINGYTRSRLSHSDRVMHGGINSYQTLDCTITSNVPVTMVVVAVADYPIVDITISGRAYRRVVDGSTITIAGTTITFANRHQYAMIGDVIEFDGSIQTTKRSSVVRVNGVLQWYVNWHRANFIDFYVSDNYNRLCNWNVSLGHRTGNLIDGDSLSIKTDLYRLQSSDYNVMLKQSKRIRTTTLHGLHVQCVRVGSFTTTDSGALVPSGDASDWVYRVGLLDGGLDTSIYVYNTEDDHQTFGVLGGRHTDTVWKRRTVRKSIRQQMMPVEVTGLQAVIDLVFGYADLLEADGWRFGVDSLDETNGRTINWMYEIEKMIETNYLGMSAGDGAILCPHFYRVDIDSDYGMLSAFNDDTNIDRRLMPHISDFDGNVYDVDANIRIFRNGTRTSIITGEERPMFNIRACFDEFEHVVLFNDVPVNSRYPIYDPFLGLRVSRVHMNTKRQVGYDGRGELDGYYLNNGRALRNVASMIAETELMFDSSQIEATPAQVAAQRLLGFEKKSYLTDLNLSDQSQFGFWTGLIRNKGSNLSVDAFLNSSRFESAQLDEVWAVKLAEYGDSRRSELPEMRLVVSDGRNAHTRFQHAPDGTEIDSGWIGISPDDDTRWIIPSEDNSICIPASVVFSGTFDVPADGYVHLPRAADRLLVRNADGTELPYELIRADLIRVAGGSSVDVVGYGIDSNITSPLSIINTETGITTPLNLYDPARGVTDANVYQYVTFETPSDPAQVNMSIRKSGNEGYTPHKAWGASQVGAIWLDTSALDYVPYYDVKLNSDIESRISRWGQLTDYARVKLARWCESTVPPSEYEALVTKQAADETIAPNKRATGYVAQRELYHRSRTWFRRTVAWQRRRDLNEQFGYRGSLGRFDIASRDIGTTMAYSDTFDWNAKYLTDGVVIGELVDGLPVSRMTYSGNIRYMIRHADGTVADSTPSNPNAVITVTGRTTGGTTIGGYECQLIETDNTVSVRLRNIVTGDVELVPVLLPDGRGDIRVTLSFLTLGIQMSNRVNVPNDLTEKDALLLVAGAFTTLQFSVVSVADLTVDIPPASLAVTDAVHWIDPTAADLVSDLSVGSGTSKSLWKPVVGDWISVAGSALDYARIDEILADPVVVWGDMPLPTVRYEYGEWQRLVDEHYSGVYIGAEMQFQLPESIGNDRLTVYVNGVTLRSAAYTVVAGLLTVGTGLQVGDQVRVRVQPITPTDVQLSFDPETGSAAVLEQYAYDYQYSAFDKINEAGEVVGTTYYYWIAGIKNPVIDGNSLVDLETALTVYPNAYAIPADVQLVNGEYRYTRLIIPALSRVVTADDKFKLRLRRIEVLRDDPDGIDLKQVHTEWALIRKGQTEKIQQTMWHRLVDTVCGEDVIGNPLPIAAKVSHDARNGTSTRYGLRDGQVMCDRDTAILAVMRAIADLSSEVADGRVIKSHALTFLDYDTADLWFATPSAARQTMQRIWSKGTARQINTIFFEVFEDMIVVDRDMPDIIKTSMIAVHSIRVVNKGS